MSESVQVVVTIPEIHFTDPDSEYQGADQESAFLSSSVSDPYTCLSLRINY